MSRARKKPPDAPERSDRLPPHSPEAEQGVLGCILLSPATCLPESLELLKGPEVFYDLRHQLLFQTLVAMHQARIPVEIITLQQRLKDSNTLDQCGGIAYVAGLPDTVPSTANLSYYANIVAEKWKLRCIIQSCTQVIGRVYEHEGEIDDLLFSVGEELSSVFDSPKQAGRFFTVDDLDTFNTSADPNSLIGRRWLCRGGKLLIPSASGAGKSSLGMQVLTLFALGRAFCGIKPARALSSLICGDENDIGDMAEMFQGTVSFLNLHSSMDHDEFSILRRNMKFWHCPAISGPQFLAKIERELTDHPRDIVLLDPLVSFAGVDLTRQDTSATFLRQGLSRISEQTGVMWWVIHHTPKTSRDPKSKSNWKASDYQYAGAGSFDLPGWARAVMTLDEATDGVFRLILSKRGKRAGATHPDGTPTTMLWLKHAEEGIHWQQIDPPEEQPEHNPKGGKPSVAKEVAYSNLAGFLVGCTPEGEGLNQIAKRLESWLATQKQDVSRNSCRRIVPMLVENGKLTKTSSSTYIKGPNA